MSYTLGGNSFASQDYTLLLVGKSNTINQFEELDKSSSYQGTTPLAKNRRILTPFFGVLFY